jgi:hypothetical protein
METTWSSYQSGKFSDSDAPDPSRGLVVIFALCLS